MLSVLFKNIHFRIFNMKHYAVKFQLTYNKKNKTEVNKPTIFLIVKKLKIQCSLFKE